MARLAKVKNPQDLFVKTAEDIISNGGIEAFNARKLAQETKYSLGSIYTYFKDINDLILQINAATLDKLYRRIQEAVIKESDPASKIFAITNTYFDFAAENEKLWQSVMNFEKTANRALLEVYQQKLDNVLRLIRETIRSQLKKGQEADDITNIIWASLQGLWVLQNKESFKSNNAIEPKKMVEILVKNLFNYGDDRSFWRKLTGN